MAPDRPDAEAVDVLVDADQIVAVGKNLPAHNAKIIDVSGRIVMPGLINAHLHTWQTGLRTIGADWTLSQYLGNSHGNIARYYQPTDMYIAALYGSLSQIHSGTTTIADWCHNNPTPEHTDAALDGLTSSGIRAVFLHGTPYTKRDRHRLRELDRLLGNLPVANGTLTVGMAIRGPQLSTPTVAVEDFTAGKERNIVVSMHQSGGAPKPTWGKIRDAELFGPMTNIAHGAGLTEQWVNELVDAGVTFTATTENELGQGHGDPITSRLLALGAGPSLGTDTDCVSGGDLLTSARIALAYQRGLDHAHHRRLNGIFSMKPTVTAKQALAWATVEGARALGLSDQIGRLEPGMQADLIVIDTRAFNLWPAHDPIAAALNANSENVEAVMIAGIWRKFDHRMTNVDTAALREQLALSGRRIVDKVSQPGSVSKIRQHVVQKVVDKRILGDMKT